MRATRGAASSAQATDRSLSGRPESSFPPLGPCSRRGRAITGPKRPANRAAPFFRLSSSATGGASPGNSPHRTRFAGLRRGPQLPQAPANGAGGNARSVYALSVQPTAAVSPRFGGRRGNTPGPFFPPISSGRNGGARRVGGAGGASDKNPAKPPSKKRRAPRGTPANNCGGKPPPYSAWQFPRQPGFYQTGDHRSPLRTARRVVAPHGPAVAGADGRMISAPTGRGDSRCLVRAK